MELPWTVALLASTAWIVYRIYLVFQKPVEELEGILGIDAPPAPDIALSTITSTSVLLYWKLPDGYHTTMDRFIQVNGIAIGPIDRADHSVLLDSLQPGNCYSIRAIASNTAGKSSYSHPIHVQTMPEEGHRNIKLLSSVGSSAGGGAGSGSGGGGGGGGGDHQAQTKRASTPRRTSHSPASGAATAATTTPLETGSSGPRQEFNEAELDGASSGTVKGLQKRLEALRTQKEELERQLAEEAEDGEASKVALTKERDELKRAVEDKERASLEFKKQVNELEKQCKAAQRQKSRKESALQQKRAERQRMRDDAARWEAERAQARRDVEAMDAENADLVAAHAVAMADAKATIEAAHAESKVLEDEIQDWGRKIKALEEDKKKADQEQNDEEREAERRQKEDELAYETRVQELQTQHLLLWRMNAQAQAEHQHTQDSVNYLLEMRSRDPSKFAPLGYPDYQYPGYENPAMVARHGSQRSRSGRNSMAFGTGQAAFRSSSVGSPTFPSAFSAYASTTGGMHDIGRFGMSQQDADSLTGGAQMSPTASKLLPSDLLGDDDSQAGHSSSLYSSYRNQPAQETSSLHGYNGSGGGGGGGRLSNLETGHSDPQSPLSAHSKSPSLISSPHESLSNVQHAFSSTVHDATTASDAHAPNLVTSTGSPYVRAATATAAAGSGHQTSNTSRIGGLFNFNRQRSKGGSGGGSGSTVMNDLPALGSLKTSQSQSFPNTHEQDAGPGPIGSSRRKLSSGVWSSPMANLLLMRGSGGGGGGGENIGEGGGGGSSSSSPSVRASVFPRRSRNSKAMLEPDDATGAAAAATDLLFDRDSSPRPPSTYSYDNAVGSHRASAAKTSYGWLAPGASRHRNSSATGGSGGGAGGGSGGGSGGGGGSGEWGRPWSQSQSRRQSLRHGSTSNLSIGSTPLEPDDLSSPLQHVPAPIGTERFRISSLRAKGATTSATASAIGGGSGGAADSVGTIGSGRNGSVASTAGLPSASHAPSNSGSSNKLNPAAPSFTTRLFSRSEGKKSAKHGEKDAPPTATGVKDAKTSDSDPFVGGAGGGGGDDSSSPPLSRLSRDSHAHSVTTSGSHDSASLLDPTTSHASASAASGASDTAPSTPAAATTTTTKEGFIQRITRKSSSSKFAIPWNKSGTIKAAAAATTTTTTTTTATDHLPSTPAESEDGWNPAADAGSDLAGAPSLSTAAENGGPLAAAAGSAGAGVGVGPATKEGQSQSQSQNQNQKEKSGSGSSKDQDRDKDKDKDKGRTSLSWSRVMGKGKGKKAGTGASAGAGVGASTSTSVAESTAGEDGEDGDD